MSESPNKVVEEFTNMFTRSFDASGPFMCKRCGVLVVDKFLHYTAHEKARLSKKTEEQAGGKFG